MDYFQLLNLKKEPFSTSPDPEFLFQSRQHLACLQKLELSIRMRRGLNVVIGDVGTGKTTLSRQLLRQLSDDPEIDVFLIFDPHFETASEALKTIMMLFDPSKMMPDAEDHVIKEELKRHLYHQGADHKKNLVMLIDEGQKMPGFFVEILRELLNYETNQYKLLQIIIFAQKEYRTTLEQYPNFADRIALFYPLNPLKFSEMRQMIRFRLTEAGAPEGESQFFTLPALWRIYEKTGGYPRKVIHICHQSLLTMIIQSRSRVNSGIVSLCARQSLYSEKKQRDARLSIKVLCVLGAAVTTLLIILWDGSGRLPLTDKGKQPLPPYTSVEADESVPEFSSDIEMTEDLHTGRPLQSDLGKIIVHPRETLGKMIYHIYGTMDRQCFQQVIKANPDIRNPHRIAAGQMIHFPFIQISSECPSDFFMLEIALEDQLKSAYQFIRQYRGIHGKTDAFRLIVWHTGDEGILFSVVLDKNFVDKQAAEKAAAKLKSDMALDAVVRSAWPDNAVFCSVLCSSEYEIHKKGKEQ